MKKTPMHPLSLRFLQPELEEGFLEDALADYARPLRPALLIGVLLFIGYAGVDLYLFGRVVPSAVLARSITVVVGLGYFAFTFSERFTRYTRLAMALLHVTTCLTMIHLATLHSSYTGGVFAAMIFFVLVARAHFVIACWINVGLFLVFAAVYERPGDTPSALVEISMLLALVSVTMVGGYFKERADRLGFLRKRALASARDRAVDASRAKSTFLANMSHELRTPLNAIIGYSEMLEEDAEDDGREAEAEDLQKIQGAGRHLLGLINDILDLSKIEAGKIELHLEDFELMALLRDVSDTVRPLIERNDNALIVELEALGGEVTMRSDSTRVRQILMNLLSNAAKFTREGEITLVAERDGGDVLFTVADTGIGMTEAQQAHVFDAFRQADTSTTRDYGGTGLGLTISLHFASMLGGTIQLASSAPGVGSSFLVRLPCVCPDTPVTRRSGEL